MAVSGNTKELSLADLILIKSHDPGTYRLTLNGPAGDGLLIVRQGRVVHAAYGELPAIDAAYLLVTEEGVDFEIEAQEEVAGQTIDLSAQELLMEAMRRYDEGILRRPRPISIGVGPSVSSRREPPRPRSHALKKSPEAEALRRATGHVLFAEPETPIARVKSRSMLLWALPLGLVAVVGVVAAFRYLGVLAPRAYRDPVRVSDLGAPRDALPILLSGAPALAPPDSDPSLFPTVLYRIRIDRDGNVHPQRPHDKREGLEAFEAAAAEALTRYKFTPARREGVMVPIEMNWPVDFVRSMEPSPTPVPVDERFFVERLDELPKLVEGEPPKTPLPERRLRPKIPCRILIDEDGRVADARVVRSRPDLAAYEEAALDALRTFRFTPGLRERQVVPTWMSWTIEFQ